MLAFPVDQVPVLAGPGQGVRMIKVSPGSQVVGLALINVGDSLQIQIKGGEERILKAADIPRANRSTQGKKVGESIATIRGLSSGEGSIE
jgi:DNA gyrase/topoisomerase IV subunit A